MWNAITTYFSPSHLAIDLGWNNNHGGSNVDVYSASDGKVVYSGNTFGTAGIMVRVRYDDKDDNTTWYFQYKHLSSTSVKTNQTIKMKDKIGNMGGTGGYDPHLHFDVIKCPYGYEYEQTQESREKYSVNPLLYCFLYPDQTCNAASEGKILRLLGPNIKTNKNASENQVEVIGYKLNCRDNYGLDGKFLGYIDYGYYNYQEVKNKDSYNWYKITDNLWVADVKGSLKVYPQQKDNDCEEKIKKLEEEIKNYQEQIKNLQDSTLKDYYVFTADKDAYYYIYLQKNEVVYYKKNE